MDDLDDLENVVRAGVPHRAERGFRENRASPRLRHNDAAARHGPLPGDDPLSGRTRSSVVSWLTPLSPVRLYSERALAGAAGVRSVRAEARVAPHPRGVHRPRDIGERLSPGRVARAALRARRSVTAGLGEWLLP